MPVSTATLALSTSLNNNNSSTAGRPSRLDSVVSLPILVAAMEGDNPLASKLAAASRSLPAVGRVPTRAVKQLLDELLRDLIVDQLAGTGGVSHGH